MTFPPVFNPKATRAVSHVFDLPESLIQSASSDIASMVNTQLAAEAQRLQRLLPDPPEDWYWELSIETSEDIVHDLIKYRAVYRLEKIK